MKKIILLIFFTLFVSCGFKPMFSNTETNFSINKIEFNNKLGKVINNNLKPYISREGKQFDYDIIISARENKIISLKDKKGDAVSFRLSLEIDLLVSENNEIKIEKNYTKKFDYNNTSKKFDLSKYEGEIKNSMLNKISEEIILDLYTIQ